MRAILIAATALTVLTTSAQAQVDHMNLTYPACVTPLHLDEADALWHAGRPVNKDVCIMLKEGTEIVRVGYTYDYAYMQIAYQQGGQTYTLFTNPSAMKGVIDEKKAAATQDKQDEQAADAFMKTVGGDFRQRDALRRTWIIHRQCVRESGPDNEVCKLGGNDLQKQLAKVKDTDGLRAEIDVLKTKYDRCTTYQKFGGLDPICKGIAGAIEDKERETFNRKHSN